MNSSRENIQQLFDSFKDLRIMVVGDVMIDAYLYGKVDRISPEAPVPVVALQKRVSLLGGAANVALNIAALGATPLLCSVIGNDPHGDELLKLMDESGLSRKGICRSNRRITTTKFRIIGNKMQMLRVDEEVDTDLVQAEEEELLGKIRDIILEEKPSMIIVQDYNKGVLTPATIRGILEVSGAEGVPVAVDPKKKNFRLYHGVDLFKPNLKELREGINRDIDSSSEYSLQQAADIIHLEQGVKTVMITLSEKGIFMSHRDGKAITTHTLPAHVRNVADVSGAGDTVISVASVCMAAGAPLHLTALLSNLAGGQVCEYPGVVPVDPAQLMTEALKYHQ